MILKEKTLNNTNINDAKKKTPDIEVFGNGDLFELICKASSKSKGWLKSTKAMRVGTGCIIQVSTQQQNPDGSYSVAEAVCFVPDVDIFTDKNGNKSLLCSSYVTFKQDQERRVK